MAEQETKVENGPIWTIVEGKNGLERAKVGAIRMSPNVEKEVQEKYKQYMLDMRDGKIQGENGKDPMVRFDHGEHTYGLTYFTDNDSFSVWRRKKGAGVSGGGGKKPFFRMTSIKSGSEEAINTYLAGHPNDNCFLEDTYPEVSSGIQQFVISSKKLMWPEDKKEESSDKTEENKAK